MNSKVIKLQIKSKILDTTVHENEIIKSLKNVLDSSNILNIAIKNWGFFITVDSSIEVDNIINKINSQKKFNYFNYGEVLFSAKLQSSNLTLNSGSSTPISILERGITQSVEPNDSLNIEGITLSSNTITTLKQLQHPKTYSVNIKLKESISLEKNLKIEDNIDGQEFIKSLLNGKLLKQSDFEQLHNITASKFNGFKLNFYSQETAITIVNKIKGKQISFLNYADSFIYADCIEKVISNVVTPLMTPNIGSGSITPLDANSFAVKVTFQTALDSTITNSEIIQSFTKILSDFAKLKNLQSSIYDINKTMIGSNREYIFLYFDNGDGAESSIEALNIKNIEIFPKINIKSVKYISTKQDLKDPLSNIVVLFGLSVIGMMGEVSLLLELQNTYHLDVTSKSLFIDNRKVKVATKTPIEARNLVKNINGREIFGQTVTAYTADTTFDIFGKQKKNNNNKESNKCINFDDAIQKEYHNFLRFSSEATYVHNMEFSQVQTQTNELPLLYRYSFRKKISNNTSNNNDNNKPIWFAGNMTHTNYELNYEISEDQKTFLYGISNVLLEGDHTNDVNSIFTEESQDKTSVILKFIHGNTNFKHNFFRIKKGDYNIELGPSKNGPWKSIKDNIYEDCKEKTFGKGNFYQRNLTEWKTNDLNIYFNKSTWNWWLQGIELNNVREVFQLCNIDKKKSIVTLRDMACQTKLRLTPDGLYYSRDGLEDDFIKTIDGTWTKDMLQWDSIDASINPQQFEAHFETREEWNNYEYWVDGTGNFNGIKQILIEKRSDDLVNIGENIKLVSGNKDVILLTSNKVVINSKEMKGSWSNSPFSIWFSSVLTEDEIECRKPLDSLYEQLSNQQSEFESTTIPLVKHLETCTDLKKAKVIIAQLSRELGRFQTRLPAYANRKLLLDAVNENQITILIGATGSGKSTQTLPFLMDSGLLHKLSKKNSPHIACTQPRKVAAVSLANYVSSEWGNKVGDSVGYKCGGKDSMLTKTTQMSYLIDRCLLNELNEDKLLLKYDCVVVDEAHERTINTDILFALLKDVCKNRPTFRLIIASATIDPDLFMQYFNISNQTAIIRIPGRTFPVEHVWMEKPKHLLKDPNSYVVSKSLEVMKNVYDSQLPGDILVFLPTPDDVKKSVKLFNDQVSSICNIDDLIILPLHGQLDQEEQQKVFQLTPTGKHKIVFSTNIAETSVTIDGIIAVIDSGLAKSSEYDAVRNMNSLVVGFITKSSVTQRAGRAGRTRPGIAYHLYEEEDFNKMPTSHVAEILRTELLSATLQLKELGVTNPSEFDFIEHPGTLQLKNAEDLLKMYNFLDPSGNITSDGNKCLKLNINCRLCRMILKGSELNCLEDVIICAGMLNSSNPLFFRNKEKEQDKKQILISIFHHDSGDLVTSLNAFSEWKSMSHNHKSKLKDWESENLLVPKVLKSINDFSKSVISIMKSNKNLFEKELNSIEDTSLKSNADWENINRSFVAGFFDNICTVNGPSHAGLIKAKDIDFCLIKSNHLRDVEIDEYDNESICIYDSDDDDEEEEEEEEECPICLEDLYNGTKNFTLTCHPNHIFHLSCIIPILKSSNKSCPLCRSTINMTGEEVTPQDRPKSNTANISSSSSSIDTKKTRPTIFIHPSSCLFNGNNTNTGWFAYQSCVETTRQFGRNVVAVDPAWVEVSDHIDIDKVLCEAKSTRSVIPIAKDLLPGFIGKNGSVRKFLELSLDIIILLPPRNNNNIVIDIEIYSTSINAEVAVNAINARINMIQEEIEQKEAERLRKKIEYEERKLRQYQEFLRRQEERARRHEEYLAREAARERRQREYENQRRDRANRSRSRPYCGTPGRNPNS